MSERIPLDERVPLTEDDLKAILQAEIVGSVGGLLGLGSDLANQRRAAMDYYLGKPFGNEVEGRSEIVNTDVFDVIEWMLPALLEIFTASGEVFKFAPVGPEDEDMAKQASDYINHVFLKDNNGFQLLYDLFKDALLQKNGILKVEWDEKEEKKRETFTDLTMETVELLLAEPAVTPVESTEREDGLWDLVIHRTEPIGRMVIYGVPPENFLISRRAEDIDDAPYLGDEDRVTVSELLEMGYDYETVMALPTGDAQDWSQERISRFDTDDEWPEDSWGLGLDPAMRQIWVTNSYIKVDWDGDGIAELRKVVTAGAHLEILENEEVDENPYITVTPIPMPHKFFGLSEADVTMDIQLIKSTLLREWLDNLYQHNNARTAYSNKVNVEDIITPRVGGGVNVDTDVGDVAGHVVPMVTAPLGPQLIQGLEYMDRVREGRTGQSPFPHDMKTRGINETATGITAILGESQKRLQLIARVFAETGIRQLGRKMLKLAIKHQDRPRMMRLRGEFVEVDPRSWNADMDVSVQVGLGYGSKEQQLGATAQTMEIQKQVVQFQGGVDGPLVKAKHIYNGFAKWCEAAGLKDAEPYMDDPEKNPQPEQPPKQDPDVVKVERDAQLKQQQEQNAADFKKREQGQKEWVAEQDVQLKRDIAVAEFELKAWQAQAEGGLDVEKFDVEMAIKRDTATIDAGIKTETSEQGREESRTAADHEHELRDIKAGREPGRPSAVKQLGEQVNSMSVPLQAIVVTLEGITERLAEIEQQHTAPKEIKVRTDKSGRITGGAVTQNGKTTNIRLVR